MLVQRLEWIDVDQDPRAVAVPVHPEANIGWREPFRSAVRL